jgi:hypothetical protein
MALHAMLDGGELAARLSQNRRAGPEFDLGNHRPATGTSASTAAASAGAMRPPR